MEKISNFKVTTRASPFAASTEEDEGGGGLGDEGGGGLGKAILSLDKNNRWPLHVACENKAPVEVIAALIAASPEAVREMDSEDRLPLHRCMPE